PARCDICTLSLHDALPIYFAVEEGLEQGVLGGLDAGAAGGTEGGETGVLELQLLGLGKESDVAGIGAGETALDGVHAELVELFRERKSTRLNSSHVKSSYA